VAGSEWRARVYYPLATTATWHGKEKRDDPLNVPDMAVISDSQTWEIVWATWQGGQAPLIDFMRETVIVAKGSGPNTVSVWRLSRNGKGDVKGQFMQTLVGGPGFCYLFLTTPRCEIRTINGQPVEVIHLTSAEE
jgi:hypothetical protein